MFLFLFSFSTSCFLICFFLDRRFRVSSFCFNSFFFSPFWSWSLCFLTSSLPFFLKKNWNFSVVIFFFWRRKCFFFETLPLSDFSRVFSSLRRHFSLCFQCFLFFRDSSLFLILIFFYQSSFWVSSKKRFVFERNQKIIDSFLNNILFEKPFFQIFPLFAIKPSSMHDLQKNNLPFVCVFKLFLKNIFFIPLFLWKKKRL